MNKYLPIMLALFIFTITGCKLVTPEIRGVVLDVETKEPVEGIWMHATIWVGSKTVAGDVGSVIPLEPPRLRTGKDGKFVIPSRSFKKPFPPIGFGTKIDKFKIWLEALDKTGELEMGLDELNKEKIEVTVYAEDIEKSYQKRWQKLSPEEFEKEREQAEFSRAQASYSYCIRMTTPFKCDEWEFNYAIGMHERYLERYPKTEETRSHISIAFEQLGLLYERKGDYEKAIDNLKKAMEIRFFRPQDLDNEIRRVQELIKSKKP